MTARESTEAENAVRFGEMLREIQAGAWGCFDTACTHPHDGNCVCFNAALARFSASGMSASGQDPQGLEAKPASPTAESGDAQ